MQLQPVPAASIFGIAITLILSVGYPVILCIVFHIKAKAKISSFFVGGLTFILFALILERGFHLAVLGHTGSLITGHIIRYALYGGLAAAAFEETGRYAAMKILMKRTLSRENAFMYGIGHGGAEAILLVGLLYMNNLVSAILINNGLMDNSLSALSEPLKASTYNLLSALWTTPSYMFFLAGIERFLTIAFHIAMSILIYKAVKDRRRRFYWMAFGLHFLTDFGTAFLKNYISPILLEAGLLLFVAVVCWFVYRIYKEDAKPLAEPVPE